MSDNVDRNPPTTQEQHQGTNYPNLNTLSTVRNLAFDWVQGFIDTIASYQALPDATPYEGYPLPRGFPFPDPIRELHMQSSNIPIIDRPFLIPLLSYLIDIDDAGTAIQVQFASNPGESDVVLVQCDVFHWIEEVNEYNQVYWSSKACLIIHGYPRLRWIHDDNGEWISPLMWELRWGITTLGALEVDSTIFQNSEPTLRSLDAQFVLRSLILSIQTRHIIILTWTAASIRFIQGRSLDDGGT